MKLNPLLTPFLGHILEENPLLGKQIEKTVCRYAKPSGCCETLVHIMNRIKNALLSLIGCSDWQRTLRAMRKDISNSPDIQKLQIGKKLVQTMEMSKEQKKIALLILNNRINSEIQLVKAFPKFFLDLSLQIQNGKFKDEDALKEKTGPTFQKLSEDADAIKQKAREEFENKGLYHVFDTIQKIKLPEKEVKAPKN